jgi:DNA-binding transcriptional ArsR family regulator
MKLPSPDAKDIQLDLVLTALGSPVRLAAVRAIADFDEHACLDILPHLPKSTKTHHFRLLRESGVVWQRHVGREYFLLLRRDDLESRFPGLLQAILAPLHTDENTCESLAQYL